MVSVMLYPYIFCIVFLMDMFVCGGYFVVECYGSVECVWRFSVG